MDDDFEARFERLLRVSRLKSMDSAFSEILEDRRRLERRYRRHKLAWSGGATAAMIVVVAGIVLTLSSSAEPGRAVAPWVYAAGAVLFVYIVGFTVGALSITKALEVVEARRESLAQKRKTLRQTNAVTNLHGNGSGTNGPEVTERQRQHSWYGDHSDLDWHDRVRAESMGLDVETYVNNVLDHDPD